MRFLPVGAALVLTPLLGHAAGVNVVAESTARPRIIVLFDGRPAQGAQVEIIPSQPPCADPTAVLRTDSHGVAIPKRLAPGIYTVRATRDLVAGEFTITVVNGDGDGASAGLQPYGYGPSNHFTLTLDTREEIRLRQLVTQAQSVPISTVVAGFHGSVTDQSGARIPGAFITLLRRRNRSKVLQIRADRAGEFKKVVPSGAYVVVVSAPGFATSVVAFRVGHDARDEHLEIKLPIDPHMLPVT